MPSADTQREAARATLRLYAQPDVAPTIAVEDLEAILSDTARATIWTAATAYSYGDTILPTIRNGHRFKCIIAGTADAATEPTWTTAQGSQITEGDSDPVLTWQEDGPDFDNLYNVRAAIHAAWMHKAAQASLSVDTMGSGGRMYASQIYDHCIKQSEKFAPVEVA